jgi:hypothetical protein
MYISCGVGLTDTSFGRDVCVLMVVSWMPQEVATDGRNVLRIMITY